MMAAYFLTPIYTASEKKELISERIKGSLVAAFGSPLMKAVGRSVETLGLWIVTSRLQRTMFDFKLVQENTVMELSPNMKSCLEKSMGISSSQKHPLKLVKGYKLSFLGHDRFHMPTKKRWVKEIRGRRNYLLGKSKWLGCAYGAGTQEGRFISSLWWLRINSESVWQCWSVSMPNEE